MTETPCIWLTRPFIDSETLAAKLAEQNIETLVAPVMQIFPQAISALPAKPDALLLTSRHAATALTELPADWRVLPVYCVGAATAEMVRGAGFTNVTHGDADVLDLLPRLAELLPPHSRILYLAGAETRVDVVTLLAAKQLQVETRVAYQADAVETLSPELIDALANGKITGVVFFSPRSAEIAIQLLQVRDVSAIDAYCLSLAVAQAAGAASWRALHVCHSPTAEAMLQLVVSRSDAKMV